MTAQTNTLSIDNDLDEVPGEVLTGGGTLVASVVAVSLGGYFLDWTA